MPLPRDRVKAAAYMRQRAYGRGFADANILPAPSPSGRGFASDGTRRAYLRGWSARKRQDLTPSELSRNVPAIR